MAGARVEEVLRKIRELTSDLESMREGISKEVFQPGKSLSCNKFAGATASSDLIFEFRRALDDLRHIVWLYAETAEFTAHGGPASQSKLMERATDILCALSLHPPLPKRDSSLEDASFVGRLLQFMEGPGSQISETKK